MNTEANTSEIITQEIPDIIKIIPGEQHGIEQYLDQADLVHNETALIRDRLIRHLGSAVQDIKFDFNNDRLDDVEKKVMAVETLNKLIDAREKSMTTRVNNRLKNKELKNNEALGKVAAELLMKIDLSNKCGAKNKPLSPENLADLDCVTAGMDCEIPETEMREDPYNLD